MFTAVVKQVGSGCVKALQLRSNRWVVAVLKVCCEFHKVFSGSFTGQLQIFFFGMQVIYITFIYSNLFICLDR